MTHGRVARTRPGRAWPSRLPAGSRCMAPTEPYSRFQGRPPVRPTGPAAATTRPPARVSCAVIRPTSGIPGWRPCRRFSRGGTNTAPGGTSVPLGRLMPIPSTGRMAIRERRAPLGEPQRPRPNSWKTAGTPPPHPSAIASAIARGCRTAIRTATCRVFRARPERRRRGSVLGAPSHPGLRGPEPPRVPLCE